MKQETEDDKTFREVFVELPATCEFFEAMHRIWNRYASEAEADFRAWLGCAPDDHIWYEFVEVGSALNWVRKNWSGSETLPGADRFMKASRRIFGYYARDEEKDFESWDAPPDDHIWYAFETVREYLSL